MAYIYLIINQKNGKAYVGKTLGTIEKRFREHCNDAFKERCEKRPLYSAMQKYGIASFVVEALEECSADEASERECYWIQKLGTFKYGYNATIGGDGSHYADYDLIYRLWQEGKTGKEIAKLTGYTTDTVKAALDDNNVPSEERKKRHDVLIQKPVMMLDKVTKEELRVFPSIKDAYIFLEKQHSGHIAAVCNGRRRTAYGYSWKYI